MAKVEIFEMSELGAGWTDVQNLAVGDKVELEMALAFGEIQNACHICLTPIGRGNACETHRLAKGSIYLP